MKLLRFESFSRHDLLTRVQQTRLRGHGQPLVYANARLELVSGVDPATLFPAQNYILTADYQRLRALYTQFLHDFGQDIFGLDGFLQFWVRYEDGEEEGPIPLTPPIVEMSRERDGRIVPLINDGMHRVYTAMRLQKNINIIKIHDVPEPWPYYAYARASGWDGIAELDELPDGFEKKTYRDPENYKGLFRDFNAVFPGVQKQRKQSNPAHLRA